MPIFPPSTASTQRRRLAVRALLLGAPLLGLAHPASASPGCQAVNGQSGTLNPYESVVLASNSQQVNQGDTVTFTSSGASSDGLVQYTGSFINIENNGSGTISNTASESDSGASGDGVQYVLGSGTVSYSITCVSQAPTLGIISYGTATPGNTITLIGAAFYGASAVNFNGVASTSFTLNNASRITATIPAVTGMVSISVTTDAGTTGSIFMTISAPTITLSPATLPAGAVASQYSQTVTASGGSAPYTYTLSGSLPTGLTFSGGVISGTPTVAGSFPLTITATDNNGYTRSQSYTLEIAATVPDAPTGVSASAASASAVVTFSAPANTGGSAITQYTVTSSPGGITATGTGSPITVSGLSNGTSYMFTVTATNAAGTSAASAASNAVTPLADAQVISGFSASPSAPVYSEGGTFSVSASGGGSGNPVVFASGSTSVCSVSGSTVTMVSAGTCTLTANQAGNAQYAAAAEATLNVAITAAGQTISNFSATPANPVYAPNGTFALSADGGASGSPVVFASSSASICSVSGSTVTMLAAGNCVLTADQAGDSSHAAATQATLQVTIAAATPTLSWLPALHKSLGEASFTLTAPDSASAGAFTYTSSNPSVASITGATVTLVGAGSTVLTVTQAAAGNYAAASASTTLTVDARPDPSREASVIDGLQAQADASAAFAAAQQDNIQGRLRQLRTGGGAGNNLSLAVASEHGMGGGSVPLAPTSANRSTVAPLWTGWAAGTLTLGQRDAGGSGRGFDLDTRGVTVGFDRAFGRDGAFGIAIGAGRSSNDIADARSDLDARQRSMSLYGLWRGGEHLYLDGLLGWGRLDFDIVRWSDTASAAASASRNGEQHFASLELGYQQPTGRGSLTGYARLDASRTQLDGYREYGLDLYDLSYAPQHVDSDTLAIGIEGSHALLWGGRALRPFWLVEYRDSLRDSGDAQVNYVVQPSSTDYTVALRSVADNAWAVGLGGDLVLAPGWSLTLQYRREDAGNGLSDNVFGLRVQHAATAAARAAVAAPANP